MNSFTLGRTAEAAAADYLRHHEFAVLDQNWRTRFCEIDIVATKAKVIYFVEVKYRQTALYGGGLEYITSSKLKQMQYAAQLWVAKHHWHGDYFLAACAISGKDFSRMKWLIL